jgi:hypothetical protein
MRTSVLRKSASALAAVMALGMLGPVSSFASSHREAPLISQDPAADATDLYMFVSPSDSSKVVLVGNHYPLGIPGAGPNYYRFADGVVYAFHIDNNGDAEEDVTYAFTFETRVKNGNTFLFTDRVMNSPADSNVQQNWKAYKVKGEFSKSDLKSKNLVAQGQIAPPAIGSKSQPNFEQLAAQSVVTEGSRKFFAGVRDDPFFVDLNVFDLLDLGAGVDSLKGANVQSIVLEVPKSDIQDDDTVVGAWLANYRYSQRVIKKNGSESNKGSLVQVSRLGMPLVNEVVVPLAFKDFFNASHPEDDEDNDDYADVILKPELARLFKSVLGLTNTPTENRDDLVTVFLTGVPNLNQPNDVQPAEMLRLNLSTAPTAIGGGNRLGVFGGDTTGFPNGRRLSDDVTDIAIQAVAGTLKGVSVPSSLGDGVNANDKTFSVSFPYLASPNTKTK